MENYFGLYKKYWLKKIQEGDPPGSDKPGGRALPPRRAPRACGAPGRPPGPIFCYIRLFALEKIRRRFLGRSAAVGDTSLREEKIETIDITNDPLIVGGPIFINIFTSTISSQTLVHLLYSIFVSKPHIGTCGLLVVLITSCS